MAEPGGWSYRQAWPAEPRHVADARAFVAQRLLANGLEGHVDVVRLVVSELATNAVVHAEGPFAVSLGRQNGSLTLRVTDASLQPLRGPILSMSQGSSGRGLGIVARLSTRWGVDAEHDGKTVWAKFDLMR
jgi:anti-sigma regulatory factor (Ser/Thr protein kinase)